MSTPLIKFVQNTSDGGSNKSVDNFTTDDDVSLVDVTGNDPVQRKWRIYSFPGPMSEAPTITNDTSETATIAASELVSDGVYIVELRRKESDGVWYSSLRWFGIPDEDGLLLPSYGQNAIMSNQGDPENTTGWAGRGDSSSNIQVDKIFRHLLTRGRGLSSEVATVNVTGLSAVTPSALARLVVLTGVASGAEVIVTLEASPGVPHPNGVEINVVNRTTGAAPIYIGASGGIFVPPGGQVRLISYASSFVLMDGNGIEVFVDVSVSGLAVGFHTIPVITLPPKIVLSTAWISEVTAVAFVPGGGSLQLSLGDGGGTVEELIPPTDAPGPAAILGNDSTTRGTALATDSAYYQGGLDVALKADVRVEDTTAGVYRVKLLGVRL